MCEFVVFHEEQLTRLIRAGRLAVPIDGGLDGEEGLAAGWLLKCGGNEGHLKQSFGSILTWLTGWRIISNGYLLAGFRSDTLCKSLLMFELCIYRYIINIVLSNVRYDDVFNRISTSILENCWFSCIISVGPIGIAVNVRQINSWLFCKITELE